MPAIHAAPVTFKLPVRGRRARLIAVGYGILVFLWLGPEDNTGLLAALLGTGLSALAVCLWALGRFGGRAIPVRAFVSGAVLLGAAIGLGASLATTALMFFKNARHAHLYPDFPPEQMGAILQRAPVWALAGGLFGLGLALTWLALGNGRHGDE